MRTLVGEAGVWLIPAEVVLDGSGADEQLCTDVGVGEAVPRRRRDLSPVAREGGAQVFARVRTPVLAPQPSAVHELGSGQMHRDPAAAESLDRFAEERLGRVTPHW